MARNRDDLLKELDDVASDCRPGATVKGKKASGTKAKKDDSTKALDPELFGDIERHLAAKAAAPTGSSRPATPRMSSSNTSTTKPEHTPASSRRTSEDPGREKSEHASDARNDAAADDTAAAAGGWWGSMFSAASAAVKHAESLAKNVQANPEAQRWAETVGKRVQGLQSLGTDLRSRALPTFTSIISHIAPPISTHERLQIHPAHDMQHYPSLDPLIYQTFARIMAQVEGGDLMVMQRASDPRAQPSDSPPVGYQGGVLGGAASPWNDGPWWREHSPPRNLGIVHGRREGSRLARVGAESAAREFFDARGGIEAAAQRTAEALESANPVRSSDIFLAIQAVAFAADPALFAAGPTEETEKTPPAAADTTTDDPDPDLVAFAIYLHDPLHSLAFHTLSQPFPRPWASWLDASPAADGAATATASPPLLLPPPIREMIAAGGLDPREWVADWLQEVLALGVGVVAQRYVARRMGVGAGEFGPGRARARARAEEEGVGGEAARAV